jgi:AraC-like DNA-binding protein
LLGLLLSDVTDRYRSDVLRVVEKSRLADPVDRYVKNAVAFIDEHLGQRIALSDAAKAAAITPNYLATLLRRETGNSFVELLTERRMAKACALLTYTSLRISQVASAVGFDDPDYFSRRFRQVTGRSPAAFRIDKARPREAA